MPNQSNLAEEIGKRLEAMGYGEWAKRLDVAVAGGSTGTEINMALGWTLRQFLKTRPKIDAETKALIKELKREISKALRWR